MIFYKIVLKNKSIDNNSIDFEFYLKPFIRRNMHVSHLPPYKKIKDEEMDCSICLEQFQKKEYYRELPFCKHTFHKKCIDRWFKHDTQMSCPICRRSYCI